MLGLIIGIVVFWSVHIFTTFREQRAAVIERIGVVPYRVAHSLVSLIGLALIVSGFAHYRAADWVQIWSPPVWTRHLTILLMWFAFVALAAMLKRPGRIRGWLRYPMLVALTIWALAHLLANGDLGGMVLFGSFLAWAIYDRIALRQRGEFGATRVPSFTRADAVVLAGGTAAYVAMIFLHPLLIGVPVIAF